MFLGRDTFEGIERLRHGIKPEAPLKRHKRIDSKVRSGPSKGAILYAIGKSETGHIAIEKPIQAGFLNIKRHEYDYFTIDEIPTAKELEKKGYAVKGALIWLIAEEGEELKRLTDCLKNKGISIIEKEKNEQNQTSEDIVPVVSVITLDRTIMRGLSKIAFNYAAFVKGANFIQHNDFNKIRRFIRYGEGDSKNFFSVNLPPILHEDQKLSKLGVKTTIGHLITLGWQGTKLFSKLSLFNTTTYGVTLCNNYHGIWHPIRAGHHFDIKSKKVSELLPIYRRLMP